MHLEGVAPGCTLDSVRLLLMHSKEPENYLTDVANVSDVFSGSLLHLCNLRGEREFVKQGEGGRGKCPSLLMKLYTYHCDLTFVIDYTWYGH